MGRGTVGTSRHVTVKSSICTWTVLDPLRRLCADNVVPDPRGALCFTGEAYSARGYPSPSRGSRQQQALEARAKMLKAETVERSGGLGRSREMASGTGDRRCSAFGMNALRAR
jgi:hypothetical protein